VVLLHDNIEGCAFHCRGVKVIDTVKVVLHLHLEEIRGNDLPPLIEDSRGDLWELVNEGAEKRAR